MSQEEQREPPIAPREQWVPAATTVVLVLAATSVLLMRGHDLLQAMAGAAGTALAGSQIAHRVIADAGPVPTVIVGAAVTAFAALLIAAGYDLPNALMAAGAVGLMAGGIADRTAGGQGPRHRF